MLATDDEITMTCEHCGTLHVMTAAGDFIAVEEPEGKAGVNGIRTHTVGGDDWFERKYIASEPKKYVPPSSMVDLTSASTPVEPDSDLIEAHNKDLRTRNIPN